jgi:transposase
MNFFNGWIMKHVNYLTKDEEKTLVELMKNAPKYRIRQRAHAIVLSSRKFQIEILSDIFDVHRDTISRWIDVWNEKRFDGLYDADKPGRPKTRVA